MHFFFEKIFISIYIRYYRYYNEKRNFFFFFLKNFIMVYKDNFQN